MIQIDSNVFVAFIAGLITIIGYFITRIIEKKRLIEQQIRDQKVPVYEEFIEFLLKTFTSAEEEKLSDTEMIKLFLKFNKKSIIWFPTVILKEYLEWKKLLISFNAEQDRDISDTLKQVLAVEKLMLSFRRDIGHKNEDFKKGELASIFINDLHKYQDILKQIS